MRLLPGVQEKMRYELLRDRLYTGDLVLFYGEGFVSWIISRGSQLVKLRLKPAPSHIGVVVRGHGPVLILESTSLSKTKTYYRGVLRSGPQLVSFSSRLKAYKGRVTVRHLEGVQVTPAMEADLEEYRLSIKDKIYEKGLRGKWEVVRSIFGDFRLPWTEKADPKMNFCSEILTALFKRIVWGLLHPSVIPNRFAPVDYADDGRIEDILLRGAYLTPEVTIT